jgi:hypothetical protein
MDRIDVSGLVGQYREMKAVFNDLAFTIDR